MLTLGESIQLSKAAEPFLQLCVLSRACSRCGQFHSFSVDFSGSCVVCPPLGACQSLACPCLVSVGLLELSHSQYKSSARCYGEACLF